VGDLVEEHLRTGRNCGVNAYLKVPGLVAGMIGGVDSIDDMGLLRHGAMPALCGGVWAPSALGLVPALVHLGDAWLAEEMTGHLGYDKHDPAGRDRAGAAEDHNRG
jgi:hypothetical protein